MNSGTVPRAASIAGNYKARDCGAASPTGSTKRDDVVDDVFARLLRSLSAFSGHAHAQPRHLMQRAIGLPCRATRCVRT